ncbi:16S rRNA (cytosine(1402)-N(4))-methyltransferase, partial [Candidatus Woesebacteria bacterium]|nr:16S rRNA (cytosine(1402)-N(4))-methyltransferase [Candidatus Woesebacteria bacterium]
MKKDNYHEPVMVGEVTHALAPLQQARIIDATVGTAGHTLEMVKAGASVLGIDADPEMLEKAEKRLEGEQSLWLRLKLVYGNFRNIEEIASNENFKDADGVLFDLGVSNLQLMGVKRGFSFASPEALLDMRID